MRTIKIAGLVSLFALSLLLSAAAQPAPSATAPTPAILANSPATGVIAATPAATPSPSPSSTPAVTAATPSPSPVMAEAATASSTPTSNPTPASAFGSNLLGGKEPVLDDEERAGVQVTDAWREKSYESMVSQAGTTGSVLFRYGASRARKRLASLILSLTRPEIPDKEPAEKDGDQGRWQRDNDRPGHSHIPVYRKGAGKIIHSPVNRTDVRTLQRRKMWFLKQN